MKFRKNTSRYVRIKYILFSHKGIDRYLPMVHVCLNHKGHTFQTTALVDSGATSTFIPLSTAKFLEMKLENPNNNVSGAGGEFQSYHTTIEKIDVIKGHVSLAEFKNLLVRVPAKDNGVPFVILGHDSIFFRFDIKFQESLSQIQLLRKKSK